MENWLRIFLLFGGCLALLLGPICAINRFPLKNKSKNKDPPKPKPKPPRINEAILPSLKDFLEEVNLSEYFRDFVRMGFVDTKHCLRLQDMDYRLMQYDWPDMTTEKINRLKESVKAWLDRAILPPEEPKDPGYEERKKIRYGRLYFPNAVQNAEYLLGSFGTPPPIGPLPIVISPSEYGCATSNQSSFEDIDLTDSVLVVRRGNCTFLEKAIEAERQHARVLVVVNNEDRLESPSSGLGVDPSVAEPVVVRLNNKITVLSTTNTTWSLFQGYTRLAQWEEAIPTMHVVPLKCQPGGKCYPLIQEEKTLQSEVSSGTLRLRSSAGDVRVVEFLTSTFGGGLPTQPFEIHIAHPFNACTEFEKTGEYGYAVLSRRGDCAFDIKAENAQKAGAMLQIIIDEEDNALQRIGGSGLGIDSVAAIFVSLPAGDFIESSINNGLTVSGHVTPYADDDVANAWIDLAFVNWEESPENRLLQIEGYIQKHLQDRHTDIVGWLRRQAEYLREDYPDVFAQSSTSHQEL